MDLSFYKLRVCDADLLLVDDIAGDGRDRNWSAAARFLLDRRRGAGANRLAVIAKAESATWLRVFSADGDPSTCLFDAALCASRFLLDSGRSSSETVSFRVPGGELEVDVLDAASLGISLGEPRGLPDAEVLSLESASKRRSIIEAGGERYEVLPLGLHSDGGKGPEAVVLFYEGGIKAAKARIRSSVKGAVAPTVLPLRLVSREEIWADAPHGASLDAAAISGIALAAAAAAGYAERGALVRLHGGELWTEWHEKSGIYTAARPEYVYRGEFHLDE
jgi:diaminopimelate epimerase